MPRPNLEALSVQWRRALDAAQDAIGASTHDLSGARLREYGTRLTAERAATAKLLESVAREEGVPDRFLSLLVPRSQLKLMLGLPPDVTACVFNLNGVLVSSEAMHLAAWTRTFDEFIHARIERTHGEFAPFNPRVDYRLHMHAKTRLEGVRAFLASRGISLTEGSPEDAPGSETVHGLANRKQEALRRALDEHGVKAFAGSRRYLEIAREVGVRCGVVSASANTPTMLDRSGLAGLIDASIDGNTMLAQGLRAKPAPDTLLAACEALGVDPRHAAAFETSSAGVAAARTGGFRFIVAVDTPERAEPLRQSGADLIVPGLAQLFDRTMARAA